MGIPKLNLNSQGQQLNTNNNSQQQEQFLKNLFTPNFDEEKFRQELYNKMTLQQQNKEIKKISQEEQQKFIDEIIDQMINEDIDTFVDNIIVFQDFLNKVQNYLIFFPYVWREFKEQIYEIREFQEYIKMLQQIYQKHLQEEQIQTQQSYQDKTSEQKDEIEEKLLLTSQNQMQLFETIQQNVKQNLLKHSILENNTKVNNIIELLQKVNKQLQKYFQDTLNNKKISSKNKKELLNVLKIMYQYLSFRYIMNKIQNIPYENLIQNQKPSQKQEEKENNEDQLKDLFTLDSSENEEDTEKQVDTDNKEIDKDIEPEQKQDQEKDKLNQLFQSVQYDIRLKDLPIDESYLVNFFENLLIIFVTLNEYIIKQDDLFNISTFV